MALPNFSGPQDQALDFTIEHDGCNLFCPPGFGKTLVGLEAAAQNTGRKLIVAPLLVAADVWPREAEKFGYKMGMHLLHGKGKIGELHGLPEVSLINYEGIPWLHGMIKKHGNPFSHVIYDEISKFKKPGTVRFRRWRHLWDTFDTRLGLTGSPVGNRLYDVWAPQFLVDGGKSLHPSFDMFKGRWFFQAEDRQLHPLTGAAQQIFTEMRQSARSWNNDHIDMPELRHHVIEIDLPAKARAWYDELHKESTIEDLDFVADNKGVVNTKHRQITGGAVKDAQGNIIKLHTAKVRALNDLMDHLGAEPALLVFEYRHDFDAIQELMAKRSIRFGFIHGGTSDAQDIVTLNKWNAGELDVFAFHPAACSYGLNLQDVGHNIIYYTVPPSLELVQQSTARIWRQGQEEPVVHAWYLCVTNSIDIKTLDNVDRKEDLQDLCFEMLAA